MPFTKKVRAELVAERLVVGLPVGLIERLVEQSVLSELLAVSVELAAAVQALQREPHPPCCSLIMCDDRIEVKRVSTCCRLEIKSRVALRQELFARRFVKTDG